MKGRYYPHPHDQGQSTVSPIRGEVDLRNFINYYLKKRDSETTEWRRFMDDRNYMLILVGLNSALRFSDLSRLTADKVDGGHLYQRDMKTGKETDFDFNPKVWAELREYIGGTILASETSSSRRGSATTAPCRESRDMSS